MKTQVIPAIDLMNGKCVRLNQGNFEKARYYPQTPVEMARRFEDAGFQYLHLVDLDRASESELNNEEIIREIVSSSQMKVDVGGGIRSFNQAMSLLESGVMEINLGSMPFASNLEYQKCLDFIEKDRLILSADVKNEMVCYEGWKIQSERSVFDYIEENLEKGIEKVSVTSIYRDGTFAGPDLFLYKKLRKAFPEVKLVASGGVNSMEDIFALNDLNIDFVIVGKAIFEDRIDLNDLIRFQNAV